MTSTIILTVCTLLLIAYIFDLTSGKTKIPSVILLLFLGWLVQQTARLVKIKIPDLNPLLPLLGSIGLILIVLEGALELEFNRSKFPLIRKSFVLAVLPILAISFIMGYMFFYFSGFDFKTCLVNAIPLSIISSSIAIPSVRDQRKETREFVIYESSLSDIIGILLFNFVALNTTINLGSFGNFGMQLLIITAISFVATVGLSLLLSKIEHHIKFAPIILLTILIYEIAKIYNLPALLFILLFGIFIGNLDELRRFKWIEKLKPNDLNLEIVKFRELITEATFLIRALFFLLFGYLMQSEEVLNAQTFKWAIVIVGAIFIIRGILLIIFRAPFFPLVYVAPRGLINILLFLSIAPDKLIPMVNKSLIIQVIFLTSIIMMIGIMITKKEKEVEAETPELAEIKQ